MMVPGLGRMFAFHGLALAAVIAIAVPSVAFAAPDEVEPVSVLQQRYEEQADDVTLPDSQIGAACCGRADIAYALGHFDTALIYYKRAMAFERIPGICYYKTGIAALANGDTGSARIFLKCVCDNDRGDLFSEAWVLIGDIARAQNKYREAIADYNRAFPLAPGKSCWAPALLGKLACARALGLQDTVTAIQAQLAPFAPELLEREAPEQEPALSPEPVVEPDAGAISFADAFGKKAPVERAAQSEKAPEIYSVLIGPYGTKTKAFAVKRKLAARFGTIAVEPVTVKKLRFYAIRIGTFSTSEDARRFAREKIDPMKPKLKYRIAGKKK